MERRPLGWVSPVDQLAGMKVSLPARRMVEIFAE